MGRQHDDRTLLHRQYQRQPVDGASLTLSPCHRFPKSSKFTDFLLVHGRWENTTLDAATNRMKRKRRLQEWKLQKIERMSTKFRGEVREMERLQEALRIHQLRLAQANLQTRSAAIIIQTIWRKFRLSKAFARRRRYARVLGVLILRRWRSYVLHRRSLEILKRFVTRSSIHRALRDQTWKKRMQSTTTTVLQTAIRGDTVRGKAEGLTPLVTAVIESRREEEEEEEDHVFLTQNVGDPSCQTAQHSQDTFACMTSEPSSPRDGAPLIVRPRNTPNKKTTRKGLLTVPSTTAEVGIVEDVDEKTGLARSEGVPKRHSPFAAHYPYPQKPLQTVRCNKQPPTNRSQRLPPHTGYTERASVQCSSRSTNDGGSSGRRLARGRGMSGENGSNKSMPQQKRGHLSYTPSFPTSQSNNRQPRRPSSAKPSKLLEGWTRAVIPEAPDADATSAAGISKLIRADKQIGINR